MNPPSGCHLHTRCPRRRGALPGRGTGVVRTGVHTRETCRLKFRHRWGKHAATEAATRRRSSLSCRPRSAPPSRRPLAPRSASSPPPPGFTLATAARLALGRSPHGRPARHARHAVRSADGACTHRQHSYDYAVRLAGASIAETLATTTRGTGAGNRGLEAWELRPPSAPEPLACIWPRRRPSRTICRWSSRRCNARGLPVIVDAAQQLLLGKEILRSLLSRLAPIWWNVQRRQAIGVPQSASGICRPARAGSASALRR